MAHPVGLTFLICELSSMIDCPGDTLVFKRSQVAPQAGSPEHDCLPPALGRGGGGPGALQTGRAYAPRVEFDYMRQERMKL